MAGPAIDGSAGTVGNDSRKRLAHGELAPLDWQTFTATLAVLAAAVWLLWRSWRFFRRAMTGGKVGDCGHCPRSKETTNATSLVQLGSTPGRSRVQDRGRDQGDA